MRYSPPPIRLPAATTAVPPCPSMLIYLTGCSPHDASWQSCCCCCYSQEASVPVLIMLRKLLCLIAVSRSFVFAVSVDGLSLRRSACDSNQLDTPSHTYDSLPTCLCAALEVLVRCARSTFRTTVTRTNMGSARHYRCDKLEVQGQGYNTNTPQHKYSSQIL